MSRPRTRRLPAPLYTIEKKIRTRGMDPSLVQWNDYFIPGSQAMRNKLGGPGNDYGISDPGALQRLEEELSMSRVLELQQNPVPGNFDYEHMKAIHHHLFQDVYDWAGQQRTVDMTKNGYEYAPNASIETIWEAQHQELMKDGMLRGINDPQQFASTLAFHWGMANFAHGFREGNTRAQTVFFAQLADEAGWDLDITKLDPAHPESVREEFVAARFHHQLNGFDYGPLAHVLSKAITQQSREKHLSRHPDKDLGSVPHQQAPRDGAMSRAAQMGPQRVDQLDDLYGEDVRSVIRGGMASTVAVGGVPTNDVIAERMRRFPELREVSETTQSGLPKRTPRSSPDEQLSL